MVLLKIKHPTFFYIFSGRIMSTLVFHLKNLINFVTPIPPYDNLHFIVKATKVYDTHKIQRKTSPNLTT